MLRGASAQEALLLSPGLNSSCNQMSGELIADESFVAMRFTASCEGVLGTAKIYNDGSFTFNSHTVSALLYIMQLSMQYRLRTFTVTLIRFAAGVLLTNGVATALLLQEPES